MKLRSLLPFTLIMLLPGCKKEETPSAHAHEEVHTVDLRLKFVFTYGTHSYEIGSEYTDVAGRIYRLEQIRFLLSDLDVVNDDLEVLATYPAVNLLVDASNPSNDFAIGSLTAGHLHQIRYNIGLAPALNAADPSTAAAPLDDASMHWGMGAGQGYWFLVLEGQVDSDNSGTLDGSDSDFFIRCGTDGLLRSGWAMMHTEVPDGGTHTVETEVDVEKLMATVDVMNNLTAMGNQPINVQLMDSLAANFHESH